MALQHPTVRHSIPFVVVFIQGTEEEEEEELANVRLPSSVPQQHQALGNVILF